MFFVKKNKLMNDQTILTLRYEEYILYHFALHGICVLMFRNNSRLPEYLKAALAKMQVWDTCADTF